MMKIEEDLGRVRTEMSSQRAAGVLKSIFDRAYSEVRCPHADAVRNRAAYSPLPSQLDRKLQGHFAAFKDSPQYKKYLDSVALPPALLEDAMKKLQRLRVSNSAEVKSA
jgi:hypothetical protein